MIRYSNDLPSTIVTVKLPKLRVELPKLRVKLPKPRRMSVRIQWRYAVAAVTLGFVLILTQSGQGAVPNQLSFFKNYFLTGGYAVGGVGLAAQGVGGIAEGEIFIGDDPSTPGVDESVPDGAEILAAFLYAQVVSDAGPDAAGVGVTFHGIPLSTPDGSFGVIGDPLGATPCWSSGGGTGQSGGNKRTYSFRYDVLRYLPVVNGRHQANGLHPVGLPDLGKKKSTPIALGASLVVIYRYLAARGRRGSS